DALSALSARGIRAATIGEVFKGSGVLAVGRDGERHVSPPEQDPFWPMFFRAMDMRGGGRS
ncbi:MAG: AIR synthase, partial [Conexivisphaera sp.]